MLSDGRFALLPLYRMPYVISTDNEMSLQLTCTITDHKCQLVVKKLTYLCSQDTLLTGSPPIAHYHGSFLIM